MTESTSLLQQALNDPYPGRPRILKNFVLRCPSIPSPLDGPLCQKGHCTVFLFCHSQTPTQTLLQTSLPWLRLLTCCQQGLSQVSPCARGPKDHPGVRDLLGGPTGLRMSIPMPGNYYHRGHRAKSAQGTALGEVWGNQAPGSRVPSQWSPPGCAELPQK